MTSSTEGGVEGGEVAQFLNETGHDLAWCAFITKVEYKYPHIAPQSRSFRKTSQGLYTILTLAIWMIENEPFHPPQVMSRYRDTQLPVGEIDYYSKKMLLR